MQTSSSDAADALAAMRASQARLVQAADCPPIRHWLFALILGALVAAPGAPAHMMMPVILLDLCAVAAVVAWDRRRTGMFVNGYRRGKTLPLTLGFLMATWVLYGLSAWFGLVWREPWVSLGLGVVAMAVGYAMSRMWARVWKRELGVGA